MAVIQSQSQELMARLREGLVQAILGDIDGFLDILTDMRLTSTMLPQAALGIEHQPLSVEPGLDGRPQAVKPVSA